MEIGIAIKVIQFSPDFGGNPLPYVPAFREWSDHVSECVQCAHVDQLADKGEPFNPMDLCEGGSFLQMTVSRRMHDQRMISLNN